MPLEHPEIYSYKQFYPMTERMQHVVLVTTHSRQQILPLFLVNMSVAQSRELAVPRWDEVCLLVEQGTVSCQSAAGQEWPTLSPLRWYEWWGWCSAEPDHPALPSLCSLFQANTYLSHNIPISTLSLLPAVG